jgi:hypothetical protein
MKRRRCPLILDLMFSRGGSDVVFALGALAEVTLYPVVWERQHETSVERVSKTRGGSLSREFQV